jgi:hypothetical protein
MIHVLNRSAGDILRLADGSRETEAIAREFARAAAIDVELARRDVSRALDEFRQLGLVR